MDIIVIKLDAGELAQFLGQIGPLGVAPPPARQDRRRPGREVRDRAKNEAEWGRSFPTWRTYKEERKKRHEERVKAYTSMRAGKEMHTRAHRRRVGAVAVGDDEGL